MNDDALVSSRPAPRHRRVVIVEYDVTRMTSDEVDTLLFGALARGRDVTFTLATVPLPGVIS